MTYHSMIFYTDFKILNNNINISLNIIPDNIAVKSNRAAWAVLRRWTKPFLTAFSDSDPITAGWHVRFQNEVPGARRQSHVTLKGAGHFLQEQAPEELSKAIIDFMKDNPI